MTTNFTKREIRNLQPKTEVVSLRSVLAELMERRDLQPVKISKGVLKQRVAVLAIDDLYIETAYQRLANDTHILGIAKDFDPRAVMLPLVVERAYRDNQKVVPDGQQRLLAAALVGYTHVMCVIVTVESLKDEAKIFRLLNIERKAVPSVVTHRNDLIIENERALELERAIKLAGYSTGQKGRNMVIKGTERLHSGASYYGYDMITQALVAYQHIWPHHEYVHLYLVCGIAMLFWSYQSEESPSRNVGKSTDISPERLARISIGFPKPELVVNYHKAIGKGRPAEAYRRESDLHYAEILVEAYNSGRRPRGVPALNIKKVQMTYNEKRREFEERKKRANDRRAATASAVDAEIPMAAASH